MGAKVSILCVTYNRRDLALRCLRSCVEQDYPDLEIVVVVNPSGDGTEQAIQENFPRAKLIQTHKNIGFFPALNLAIANSTGEFVMMVDDDAYFLESKAITCLVSEFQKEPRLGAVTCNLEGPNETPVNTDRYIEVFTTGFTMVPRQVFTEWVGYYPDLFFRSAGETYICTRLWELGHPVKRLSNVRMYHERAIEGRSDRDWKFHALRSQILCTIMREPWYLIPLSLFSKWCKSLLDYTRRGNFWTWLQTWTSAFWHLPVALRLRLPISWHTQKLLWRLRKGIFSDLHSLSSKESMTLASKP